MDHRRQLEDRHEEGHDDAAESGELSLSGFRRLGILTTVIPHETNDIA